MSKVAGLWFTLSTLGTASNMPAYAFKKRVVVNQLNILTLLLSLAWLISSIQVDEGERLLLAGVSFFCVLLNAGMIYRMTRQQFPQVVAVLLFVYPPLICAVSLLTGQMIVLYIHFILSAIACFLLQANHRLLLVLGYNLFWFTAGNFGLQVMHGIMQPKHLVVIASITFIAAAVLYFIKQQVWQYEQELKQKNVLMREQQSSLEEERQQLLHTKQEWHRRAESLAGLNAGKTKLIDSVSNDLKIHVQKLQYSIRLAEAQTVLTPDEDQRLMRLRKEWQEASRLVEDLNRWSRMLMTADTVALGPVHIGHLAIAVARYYEGAAQAKNIQVDVTAERGLVVMADVDMLEKVLSILVSYGISHAGANTRILIQATGTEEEVKLLMKAEAACDRCVSEGVVRSSEAEDFYNLDQNHRETTMNLLLTKELVERNDGHLLIVYTPDGAASAEICLPRCKAA